MVLIFVDFNISMCLKKSETANNETLELISHRGSASLS